MPIAEPTRAEIESVAIALYESDCRSFDKGRPSWTGNGLSTQVNPVDAAVTAWASYAPWAELEVRERERWRKEAADMLAEPHPYTEIDDGYPY